MPKFDSRGFTLLEAVVALAILGLAGVSALEALGGELRAADRAAETYRVAALAQDRLAVITLAPRNDLQPLVDSLARGEFPAPFTGYRWTASIRPVLGERDLYDVTVTVIGAGSDFAITTRLYRPAPLGAVP